MELDKINILLASKSPRRKELLELAGYQVKIINLDVEEDYPDTLEAHEVAEYLSIKKASPFNQSDLKNSEFLITADSIVVLDDIIYGKPTTKDDAIRTLSILSDRVHIVYTGVCIKSYNHTISFTERSDIKFSEISADEIEYYLEKCKPYDKAGSYGIQDWIGHTKVEWIKGTMNNIMGLPLKKVYDTIWIMANSY
jgi:septum formation protein